MIMWSLSYFQNLRTSFWCEALVSLKTSRPVITRCIEATPPLRSKTPGRVEGLGLVEG